VAKFSSVRVGVVSSDAKYFHDPPRWGMDLQTNIKLSIYFFVLLPQVDNSLQLFLLMQLHLVLSWCLPAFLAHGGALVKFSPKTGAFSSGILRQR